MVRKSIRVLAFLLSVGLLTLMLALAWEFPTIAQTLPGLGWSENEVRSESYVPVFTMGNVEVAPVFLDGKLIGTVASAIALSQDKDEGQPIAHKATTRSHLIHSKLQKILGIMSSYSQEVLPQRGISLKTQEKELRKQLVTNVSEERGTAVVSVTFPQDDVPEIIYSVTQADIEKPRFGGSQPFKIAHKVAKGVENVLIQAWKERQTPHLLAQAQRALFVLVALSVTSLSLGWLQKRLIAQKSRLSHKLSNSEAVRLQDNWTSGSSQVTKGFGVIASQLQKRYLEQRYSLNALYRSGLFWTQWLLWLLGIGYLSSLFYWSRPLSNWIVGVTILLDGRGRIANGWPPADWLFSFGHQANLGMPLFVLLLLLATRLTLKGGDALSDFLARHWSETRASQRHTLRAPTLTKAFKGWLRAIVYLLLGVAIVLSFTSVRCFYPSDRSPPRFSQFCPFPGFSGLTQRFDRRATSFVGRSVCGGRCDRRWRPRGIGREYHLAGHPIAESRR